jgi:iron complex outermembrane recepter protein
MANYDVLRRAVRYALFANAAAAVVIPVAHAADAPAAADEATPLNEVIVTGTRLIEPGLTSVSPVTSVSAEQIKEQGSVRIEDLLNTLPQVFADQGSSVSNGATGEATVNLRNLGVQRTLVLINGRRLMPGDPAPPQFNGVSAPDLNNIPAALVERVDVLTGGSSSTYGADAVAGVVNFVMNDHFEGVKIDTNVSAYQHSQHNPLASVVKASGDEVPSGSTVDGPQRDITILFGKNLADGAGNFTAYAGYREISALLENARDFSACTPGLVGTSTTNWTCEGSSTNATGRFIPTGLNGVPNSTGDFTVGPGGAFIPFTNQAKYNFAPTNFFQRPDERWTAGNFMHFDLTPKTQVYEEFMFMHDSSIAQIAPGGAFFGQGTAVDPNTGIPNGSSQTNCSNPLLSASELAALCNGQTAGNAQFLLGRRDVEGGPRTNDLEHTSFRAVVGLKGELFDGWKYDTYFQEGRTEYSNFGGGNFSKTALANALNVVTGPGGTPVCQSGALGCVPYNIWTPGGVTQAALNYVDIPTVLTGNTEERIWDGNITGDLGKYGLTIPGNDSGLIVNVGSQWRSEHATLHSDAPDINFDVSGSGSPVEPLDAGFGVWEGYFEGGLPIISDKPWAKELSAEVGYRYSSYNLGFNTNTYKFGVNYAPTSDIRFRASYNRAVRAPNLQELFSQKLISLEGSSDPCASSASSAPSATLAQCMRTGVTAAQYGPGKILPSTAGQYQGLVGGNPQLQPEKSDTVSFGVVLTPSFVENLSVELDYYDIRIKNVISSYTFPLELNQCLNTGNSYFCGNVHRDSNGTLWASPEGYINDPTLNLGALQNKGVDVQANYKLDLNQLGKLSFGLYGTYTTQLITQPGGQLGVLAYNCAGYFGSTCGVPTPKWKHKLRVTYDTPIAGLGVGAQWRFIGGVTQDVNSPNELLQGTNGPPGNIPTFSYLDMTASYAIDKNITVRVGVNNVLDKDPPLVSVNYFSSAFVNGNTYPGVYDSLGRYLFMNLTMQF